MIARESAGLLSYQGVIAISYTNKASDELKGRCDRLGIERGRSFFGTIDKFCVGQIIAPFLPQLIGHGADLDLVEDDACEEWKELGGRQTNDPKLKSFLVRSLDAGRIPIGSIGPAALLILDLVPQARIFISARYTSIFVDEYQDCDLYQHLFMKRLVSYGLRGIAVGDIDQAIFRFADKSPEYLSELMKAESFQHFRITKNHRCDKAIQAYSLALLGVPTEPIESTERRVFAVRMQGDERILANGIRSRLHDIMRKYGVDDYNKVAIIGSANAVLDIYSISIGLPSKRFANTPLDSGFSRWRRVFADLLTSYYDPARFSGLFLDNHIGADARPAKRNRGLVLVDRFFSLGEDELADRVGLAVAIAKLCEPNAERDGDVDAYLKTVSDVRLLQGGFRPSKADEINILTYYKAKGLEFDIVFCLEAYRFLMPPYRYEKKPFDAYGQSLAMHYVGITRAKKVCYILMGDKRHDSKGRLKDAEPSEFLCLPGLRNLRYEIRWTQNYQPF